MSQVVIASSPAIRKQILQALDECIIPALQYRQVLQVFAEPPFDFSQLQCRVERKKLLPDKQHDTLQVVQYWDEERMLTLRAPAMSFVYEGINYERVGVTTAMSHKMPRAVAARAVGITEIHLPAPAIITYPSHVPRSDGKPRAEVWPYETRYLQIKFMDEEVLVALAHRQIALRTITHNLEIRDSPLLQMGLLYLGELRQLQNRQGAQAQLLAFMWRLKHCLTHGKPQISNSYWPDVESSVTPLKSLAKSNKLSHDVIRYIQTHLHAPLTLETIAEYFGYSTFHLNRVFQQAQGTTVMRYVTILRVNAAKGLLVKTNERTSDVAILVGFSTAASFCNVFRKHTGLTPNEYRRRHALHLVNVDSDE
jgi:AraC-like DNA-binding protein